MGQSYPKTRFPRRSIAQNDRACGPSRATNPIAFLCFLPHSLQCILNECILRSTCAYGDVSMTKVKGNHQYGERAPLRAHAIPSMRKEFCDLLIDGSETES